MATDDEVKTSSVLSIIIDNGSGTIKAGLSDNDVPTAIFPSIVGKERHQGIMLGGSPKSFYIGNEAQSKRGLLQLRYPIEQGVITNFEHITKLWQYTFNNELNIDNDTLSNYPLLLTECPLNPKLNRTKTSEIVFETFNMTQFQLINTSVLSLFASGKVTGLVCESGDGVTHSVPIYEGISRYIKAYIIHI